MVHSSSNINPRALSALVAFHLHALTEDARFTDFPQSPADTLSELAGIGVENGIFSVGFDAGIKAAAAVLSDALGEPTEALRAIVEEARHDVAGYRNAARRAEEATV